GTIVRTPGDFNAFSFEDSYLATGGFPVLSLSFRAATGGLRKDPKPVARALPAFFANLLPECNQQIKVVSGANTASVVLFHRLTQIVLGK
ncbi:HipA N-terminal domain-containing protein, partial [Rhizobium ruizarguesonis]